MRYKSKLPKDVNDCFERYNAAMNKMFPVSTMLEWPSRAELDESSAKLKEASDRLMEELMAMKEKRKRRKVRV